ncbi:MAG: F0F1 ATP synthase subunit epsilon [Xanthobacteraceae bacterium]
MATFHFDLVSPERLVFAGDVDQVDVPGVEGEFGVLAGHAPYVATLKPGVLLIFTGAERRRIVVSGGLAEVNPEGLTILAETATDIDQLDPATLAAQIEDAVEDVEDAADETARDKARQRLEQLRTLQAGLAR